jgi:hypothetical protein
LVAIWTKERKVDILIKIEKKLYQVFPRFERFDSESLGMVDKNEEISDLSLYKKSLTSLPKDFGKYGTELVHVEYTIEGGSGSSGFELLSTLFIILAIFGIIALLAIKAIMPPTILYRLRT